MGWGYFLGGRWWWPAVTQKGRNQRCSFFQASSGLTASLSLSLPISLSLLPPTPRPTMKIPRPALLHVIIGWSFSSRQVPWWRIEGSECSHFMHTDDIVWTRGKSCEFVLPFPGRAGKVPSEGAQRYFPIFFSSIPLGWKVLNIGLLRLDVWILLTRTLKLLFAFKLNGF